MCAGFRRASRSLSQLYDEAMRPSGVRSTQFTLLQALSLTGEITQGELGRILALDSTTLTRMLAALVHRGWIQSRRGKDRRERLLRLAKAGERQLARGLPAWEKIQARLRHVLGDHRWRAFLAISNELTDLATHLNENT